MEMFERVRTVLGLPVFLNSVRGVAAALEDAQNRLSLSNACSTEALLAVIAEARNALGVFGQCDAPPDASLEWDHACIAAHLVSLLAEVSVKEHPLELWAQGGAPVQRAESIVRGVLDSFSQAPIRRPAMAPEGSRWKALFARTNPWPEIWDLARLRIDPTQDHEVKQRLVPVLRTIHDEAPATDVELARVLVDIVHRDSPEPGLTEQESEPGVSSLDESVRRWRACQRTKTLWQSHLRSFPRTARLCDPYSVDPILDAHLGSDGTPSIASGLRRIMPTLSMLATKGEWRRSYAAYREDLPAVMQRIEDERTKMEEEIACRVEAIIRVAVEILCRRALQATPR